MFCAEMCKISEFSSENFRFLVVKFSIYLDRRVFLMTVRFFCHICSAAFLFWDQYNFPNVYALLFAGASKAMFRCFQCESDSKGMCTDGFHATGIKVVNCTGSCVKIKHHINVVDLKSNITVLIS